MNEINWKMLIVPVVILFVFIGGIIGIVNWQKSQQSSAITVNIPEGDVQTSEKNTVISGTAEPGSKVSVNGKDTKLGDDGSFSQTVTLNEGENKIVIKSEKDGKKAEVDRKIKLVVTPTGLTMPTTTKEGAAPTTTAPLGQTTQTTKAPAGGASGSPVKTAPAAGNLSTSGPEDIILPVAGFAGVILVGGYYLKSRKRFERSMRK